MALSLVVSPVNMEERKNLGVRAGDTVRVSQKITEKGKVRVQLFEGLVLTRKHGAEAGGTFTVRKVVDGIGVERTFPLYSPMIDKIEIVRRAKVRRAKLNYIRTKVAREIKRQMRNMVAMNVATGSDIEEKDRAQKEAAAAETARAEAEAAEAKRQEEEAARAAEATAAEPEPAPEPEPTPEETPTEEKAA